MAHSPRRWRTAAIHALRVVLLGGIVWVIHLQHEMLVARQQAATLGAIPLSRIASFYPQASSWGDAERHGGRQVLNAAGQPVGFVIQTSPESNRFLGFSGATNLLVMFDADERILGAAILSSDDTRDHVELIARDRRFLQSFAGLSWQQAAQIDVDGVAGATLTSLSIVQGLRHRLGAHAGSLKFPAPMTVHEITLLFPQAADIVQDSSFQSLWHVHDATRQEIGLILRTSPAADDIVGYQGPTEARIGFTPDGQTIGVVIGTSYDNEPYVGYARQDEYFRQLFNTYSLAQLATLDLQAAGVEGVSGATMTSQAVARGLVAAARAHEIALNQERTRKSTASVTRLRTSSTLAILGVGMLMALTKLRGHKWFRFGFQVFLIGYLGLVNGDLLSLAMLTGWSQHGVPWQNALGLVALSAAAVILPITTKHNVYCAHLCPHGAVQQWLSRCHRFHVKLPRWIATGLLAIRPLLLAWVLFVAMTHAACSLVDIEPFDAYLWRAAGWPTIAVAIVGLVASLIVPMAYCRYGCPTGAVLAYLRRSVRSDRWGKADWFATACLIAVVAQWVVSR